MYKHKTEKDIRCPLEYGMDVFGGKWKPTKTILAYDMQYEPLRKIIFQKTVFSSGKYALIAQMDEKNLLHLSRRKRF